MKGLQLIYLFSFLFFSCSKEVVDPINSTNTNPNKNNPPATNITYLYPKSTKANFFISTSYSLSNYDLWINSNDVLSNGSKYILDNPLLVIQTAQIDINMDGFEDIFTYDSYPLNVPTPNPPPSVFLGDGNKFNKVAWSGPTLKDPHGTKLLVGDFNGDSYPDIFSLVAVDPPNGAFPTLTDFNNLLFNSPTGFNQVREFSDQLGFWYSGCSGDIDNDGDLDIIMFNFHTAANGVKNKILWNDGKGNFTYDLNGIGSIQAVDESELFDVNNDGYLDLVLDHIDVIQNVRIPKFEVLLGNGKGFNLNSSPTFTLNSNQYISDINFADLDSDSIQEIIIGGSDGNNSKFWIEVYKSTDKAKSYVNATSNFVESNTGNKRFDKLRVQDIDENGKLDIFASDKADNIRWEWNGSKFKLK